MNGLDEERMGYERLDVWTRGWMQAADTESGRGEKSAHTSADEEGQVRTL